MKKNLLLAGFLMGCIWSNAQESMPLKPISSTLNMKDIEPSLHSIVVNAPDLTGFEAQDIERDHNGELYRMGVTVPVNINLNNSGTWSILSNGDRVWRLQLSSPGAKGNLLFFSEFFMPVGARMHVYSPDRRQMLGAFTSYNNHSSGIFATALVKGEACIIEYYEPIEVLGQGVIAMNEFGYAYRAVDMVDEITEEDSHVAMPSEPCEVDVKCPEGTAWPDQIRGVCRIQVKVGSSLGWCSGSAINNTAADCTPYVLTAQHCGAGASTADFNAWKFYFNYQRSGCGSGTGVNNVITGAALIANSNDVSGSAITKSDFILCETNNAFPTAFNVYLNGWSRANTASSSGVSIHHPAGDFKKISTYTSTLVSSTWSGTPGTHWRVVWAATATNHGVTEGGSSGSPIFNSGKLICGQLSGGSSFCTSPTAPDLYGKFSYNWDQCGTTTNRQLKPWLDPTSSGVTTLAGMNATCTTGENELPIENLFGIYPNPVADILMIDATGLNETIHTVYIYDETGKMIHSIQIQPGRTQQTIDVSSLANGVYNIYITNGERAFSKKFVKI